MVYTSRAHTSSFDLREPNHFKCEREKRRKKDQASMKIRTQNSTYITIYTIMQQPEQHRVLEVLSWLKYENARNMDVKQYTQFDTIRYKELVEKSSHRYSTNNLAQSRLVCEFRYSFSFYVVCQYSSFGRSDSKSVYMRPENIE